MNSEFDQDKKSKQKSIIPKFTRIVDNKPPQRVPAPSTSVDITAPETIRTRKLIHQRRMRNNIPMTSISKEMVDVGKVRFNLSQQRVAKNSDNWRQQCLEKPGEHEAKKANNHSLRQSNPQVIPDERKQTSARHACKKTIQRLTDEIQEDNLMSLRNTKAGSIPKRCQMDEELQRRQMENKKQQKENLPKFNRR